MHSDLGSNAKIFLGYKLHGLHFLLIAGIRQNAEKVDLSEILPEEVEEEVKAAAEISMGTEVLAHAEERFLWHKWG